MKRSIRGGRLKGKASAAWVHQRYVLTRPAGGTFAAEGRRSEDGGRTWIVTYRARVTTRR
jgi:hypothetical protein